MAKVLTVYEGRQSEELEVLLAQRRHEVTPASSAPEAMELIRNEVFDVVITDGVFLIGNDTGISHAPAVAIMRAGIEKGLRAILYSCTLPRQRADDPQIPDGVVVIKQSIDPKATKVDVAQIMRVVEEAVLEAHKGEIADTLPDLESKDTEEAPTS